MMEGPAVSSLEDYKSEDTVEQRYLVKIDLGRKAEQHNDKAKYRQKWADVQSFRDRYVVNARSSRLQGVAA